MLFIDEYDETESIPLAEALQKKAEKDASDSGLPLAEVKKQGINKYNEVRRKHAIEFLDKLQQDLETLSNQTIANLLKALIALGLSIEDEEELEYWLNMLTREVLLRLNEYFNQRSTLSLWKQVNSKAKPENLDLLTSNDISALYDMVDSLKKINLAKTQNETGKNRIDKFLGKMQDTLNNDLKLQKDKQRQSSKRKKNQNSQEDNALDILKNKMTAEGIESGGRYWTEVIADFEMATDKNGFARNWVVDNARRNECDIQKINELRGIEAKKQRETEQQELNVAKERELSRQQDENQKRLKQEKERQDNIKNNNKDKIEKEFQNSANRKAAEKYADKKQKKTGKSLDDKDIKMMKIKAAGKGGR